MELFLKQIRELKEDHFTVRIFRRIWIPAIFSALSIGVSDLADALVLGNKVGEMGLAAISICMPIYLGLDVLVSGLAVSGSTRFAKTMSKGQERDAEELYTGVILFSLIISVLLAGVCLIGIDPFLSLLGTNPKDGILYTYAKEYAMIILAGCPIAFAAYITNSFFMADGREKLASFAGVAAIVCNVVLNILLIWGFDLGVRGAAIATVASYSLNLMICLPGVLLAKGHTRFVKCSIVSGIRLGWQCLKSGIVNSIGNLYEFFFVILVNHLLMGMIGEMGVAAFDIVAGVYTLTSSMQASVTEALGPLISTYHGEHYFEGQRNAFLIGLGAVLSLSLIVFVPILSVPQAVCAVFGLSDPNAVWIAVRGLRWFCVSGFFAGAAAVLQSCLYAAEREKEVLLLTFLKGVGIRIPVVYLCSLFGIGSFWIFYPLTEILVLAAYLIARRLWFCGDDQEKRRTLGVTFAGENGEISDLSEQITVFGEQFGVPAKVLFAASMAAEEICVAIREKGLAGRTDGLIQVTVVLSEEGDVELHIRDNAEQFNPFDMSTDKASADGDFDMDAMGMMVIKNKAKDFYYRQYEGFNTMVIRL